MYHTLVKTPSPYEEDEFVIPEHYSSTKPIDWFGERITVDAFNIVRRKAFEFVLQKHKKRGGVISTYGLYYEYSDTHSNLSVIDNNQYILSYVSQVNKYWVQLMQNIKVKIIFIPLTVDKIGSDSHANMIIVDKRRKCVEFFDPHGSLIAHDAENLISMFSESYVCNSYLNGLCFIPNTYRVKTYGLSCPSRGFQYWESLYGTYHAPYPDAGYCMFWTVFMLDLRLSNLSRETEYVQKKYIRMSLEHHKSYRDLGESFRKFIIEYSNYWGEKFSRRNPKRSCTR